MNLTIGFSPCPNDTFMFDALVHGKIDTQGLTFEPTLEDVETLNRKARNAELDITKLSFAAFTECMDNYQMLTSGAALGNGVGPLLISYKDFSGKENEIKSVAIPGKMTTAFFLFQIFYPFQPTAIEKVFSEIENSVLSGEVDAGIIIHENRFTYANRGLRKIADLGELWEKKTSMAIPLGGIAVKRFLPESVKQKLNTLVSESVKFAMNNPDKSLEFVRRNAQEMNEEVMQKHINLYVNNYSVNLGEKGKESILHFLKHSGKSTDAKKIFVL